MKHGKRPTVAQCKLMAANGIDSTAWLVAKDTPQAMIIVHRTTGQTQEVPKRKEW